MVFDPIRAMLNGKTLIRFTENCRSTELQDGKNSFFPDFTPLFWVRFLSWTDGVMEVVALVTKDKKSMYQLVVG